MIFKNKSSKKIKNIKLVIKIIMLLIEENSITFLAEYPVGILRDMKVLIAIRIFTFHKYILLTIIYFYIINFLAIKALYPIVFLNIFKI